MNDGESFGSIQARRKEETNEKRHSHKLTFQHAMMCLLLKGGQSSDECSVPWREWRPPPPRYLPMQSVYSEGRRGDEREMEGNRDRPRIDPGGAPICKERVGSLFPYRFCWFWFSESLEVHSRLDTGLPLNCWLVNRKGLELAQEERGGDLVRGNTACGRVFACNIRH